MSSEPDSMAPPPAGEPLCPHCGATNSTPAAARCWLCHGELTLGVATGQSAAGGRQPRRRVRPANSTGDNPAWAVFGVLALLLAIGLALDAPGILVVLLALLTPALIRTVVASARARPRDGPPNVLTTVGVFFSSVGIVAMVGLAAVAAFFGTCFVVCFGGMALGELNQGRLGEWIWPAAFGISLLAGLAVAVLLFRRLWPERN